MNAADDILANIIQWATEQEPIRALVLVGSRARGEPTDELADFDVSIFARTCEPYVHDDRWLSRIGAIWVYVPDQYGVGSQVVPTRLVIYEGGIKVDFAFHTTAMFDKVGWNSVYKVLLDKDGLTANIAELAHDVQRDLPAEKEFATLVNEFWFEACHVAKYLKREELWLAKSRDWATKEFLLTMIEWHQRGRHGRDYDTHYMGKHLRSWVDPDIWEALHQVFAHWDSRDSWHSLQATTALFRRLAEETAQVLGFGYPTDMDQHIGRFIEQLQPPDQPRRDAR